MAAAAAAAEAVLHLAAQIHSALVLIVAEARRIQLQWWCLSCDSRMQEWASTALDTIQCYGSTIRWDCNNHHTVSAIVSVLLPGRWSLL